MSVERLVEPGVYPGMTAAAYHLDPCPEPSLSSGIAATLLAETPLAAWMQHPKLNPDRVEGESTPDQLLGTACHKLLLGRGREIVVCDVDSWRSNAAKATRDAALESGLLPLKRAEAERAQEIAEAARAQLDEFDPEKWPGVATVGGEGQGLAEAVVIVRDPSTGIWLRIMCDWLDVERGIFWDYKTGKGAPAGISKQIARMGYHFQLAFYAHVLETALPELAGRIDGGWIYQQTTGAKELRVVRPCEADLAIGRRQVQTAIADFAECLRSNRWPSYRREVETIVLPPFAHSEWLEREMTEETVGSASSWAFAGGRD